MDAKDLRIGNWVNTPFGIKQVYGIKRLKASDKDFFIVYYDYDEYVLLKQCELLKDYEIKNPI